MTDNTTTPPIICDMTDAPDTAAERVAEYERLFTQALVGRDHIATGIRFRFRADDGTEDWVRDLAAREKACCAFYDFDIAVHDDEIWWDLRVPDDPVAHELLEDFYRLPDTISAGPAAILEQFGAPGPFVQMRDNGTLRPATRAELGLT